MSGRQRRQTHQIERRADLITKTYRSWQRNEHRREWRALTLVNESAPGLCPCPISARLDANPPSITMTLVPGEPIPGEWTDDQLEALAGAMDRLWHVPVERLPPTHLHDPAYWRNLVARTEPPVSGVERQAYDQAATWLNGSDIDFLSDPDSQQVLGQGDPQIDNLLFDQPTGQIRLIDFEDAGASDRCFELANFAEHLGNRNTGLHRLADHFDVDRRRLHASRRLLACFWLLLLRADPTRDAELREQAHRVLMLFDAAPT